MENLKTVLSQAEYERQAPYEIGIDKILCAIDIDISNSSPFYLNLKALYIKCSPILDNKEIDDLYQHINTLKDKTYKDTYDKLCVLHSDNINAHVRVKNWSYMSNKDIIYATMIYTNKIITPECEKLYMLILKELKKHKLILLSKKELESSHE